ncbi:MAG: type II toxin-antitoxin system VapC family toxin [Chloroflexota bacterium]|nr:type II toxin-antitoxin system VapC family toxin [Chloroflexota bacterium]
MANLPTYILDAFAFMAYLENEPGAERIEQILQDVKAGNAQAFISIINLGEVIYSTERRYGLAKAQDTLALIQRMPIDVLPADNQTVLAAAHIKANHPISYADAFVGVAAQKLNGIIMTGDSEFQDITELAQIEWLKRRNLG